MDPILFKTHAQKRNNFPGTSAGLSLLAILILAFILPDKASAEGSRNFANYPGYRLYLDTREDQQMKVFVNEGEYINVGASHVGIAGGFIKVYRPDGTLKITYDGSNTPVAIIQNNVQEAAGPNGGGSTAGAGYVPGIVQAGTGEAGIWTVIFDFPDYSNSAFTNILNSDPWSRAVHQDPSNRAIVAWDITVTIGASGNTGGASVKGRVFSNEYVSIINQNGYVTSPTFFILTKGGFIYKVDFHDTDPFRFPISSNSNGLVYANKQPSYKSLDRNSVVRSDNPAAWVSDSMYYFEPQAQDSPDGTLINNKVFFNPPDPTMPATAIVTDIFRNNTYTTWLLVEPSSPDVTFQGFEIAALNGSNTTCLNNTLELGLGGYIKFTSSQAGTAFISLDLNNDGDFHDAVDRRLFKLVQGGTDSIFWDGKNGLGEDIPVSFDFAFSYKVTIRGGETHIIMSDVENNMGGVTFKLYNDLPIENPDAFYYDHSIVGGGVSGNGSPGEPVATLDPFTYSSNFGNNKMLDYWIYVPLNGEGSGTFIINIAEDCTQLATPDTDRDGIIDLVDIDDDNDGVPDAREYCNNYGGGFACLPGGMDPSHDEDGDGVPNYLDPDDATVSNGCIDADGNGICDKVMAVYDTDGDGVPDHLDLDSDNDGITDLVEAGHLQPDLNGNGIIDGEVAEFGANGLYNPIASDADALDAVETYVRWDVDTDGIPDHDDLDSDNDGINDVAEAGFAMSDTNLDGRIDNGSGAPPVVGKWGLAPVINPESTGLPIPLPRDKDADGIPDWHDLDSDNDLIHDVEEGGNPDPDNDAIIGAGIPVVDGNGKATADTFNSQLTTTSRPLDTDNDAVPDFHDLDSDNDGINDVKEAGGADPDNNALPGLGMPSVNTNGIPVSATGQPFNPTSIPNDQDADGVRDYRDLDADNDGINDVMEAGKPDPDGDGIIGAGTPTVNVDGRATADGQNTPLVTTSKPTDTDGDQIPDFLELDSDNDGVSDVTEGGNPDPDFDGIIGTGIPVINQEGQAFDDPTNTPLTTTSNPTDTDGDGIPDFQELDSDDDGLLDADECPVDKPCTDGDADGIPDFQDIDRDNDGISDSYECDSNVPCTDTDGDGIPDVDDLDTDGDGLLDALECPGGEPCPDSNNNGVPDWREYQCNPSTVLPEISNLNGSGIYCEGEQVILTAANQVILDGPVTYKWTGPNGFNYTGITAPNGPFEVTLPSIENAQSGSFSLQLFTEHGCPSEPLSLSVTVLDLPETPALNVDDDVLCEGELIELNSSIYSGGNVTYEWFFNDGTNETSLGTTNLPTFFIENADQTNNGVYTVSVTKNGCQSQRSNAQDVHIETPQSIAATNTTDAGNPACEGDAVQLSVPVIMGATYEWVGPMNFHSTLPNPVIEWVSEGYVGEYFAMVHTLGCNVTTSSTTVHVFNEIEATDDFFGLEFNQMLESADLVTNDHLGNVSAWLVSVVKSPAYGSTEEKDGMVTYTPQTNYYGPDRFVYEVCNKWCPDICSEAVVNILISGSNASQDCFIPNVITPNEDGLNDFFRIPCLEDNYTDNSIRIFNRWGDLVYQSKPYRNDWSGTYKEQPLPPGTYFYLLQLDEKAGGECKQGYFTITR